jgi:uncharacterized protein (TIGR00369 family)
VPDLAPNAHRFEPLPPERAARWEHFANWPDQVFFPSFVGLVKEEIRTDYCRLRLPYRPELNQPAGVVHGGALATLVDTVVVPAVGAVNDERPVLLTISMTLNYLAAIREQDAIAEGWVERRGRSTVYCRAEVRDESGELAVTGSLVYAVRLPNS